MIKKILVKFPTRERPSKFKKVIEEWISKSSDKENIRYEITLDRNDPRLEQYNQLIAYFEEENIGWTIGDSKGKIDAVNRDMNDIGTEWDVLVLASDDMICKQEGWDEVIRMCMEESYTDTDGALWFYDGYQPIYTMPILGREYYKRFNWIYHPAFVSLWCDNLMQDTADELGKLTKYEEVLFAHEQWFNSSKFAKEKDALQIKEQKFFLKDKETYDKIKQSIEWKNFIETKIWA